MGFGLLRLLPGIALPRSIRIRGCLLAHCISQQGRSTWVFLPVVVYPHSVQPDILTCLLGFLLGLLGEYAACWTGRLSSTNANSPDEHLMPRSDFARMVSIHPRPGLCTETVIDQTERISHWSQPFRLAYFPILRDRSTQQFGCGQTDSLAPFGV